MRPFNELVDHGQDVLGNCQVSVVYYLLMDLPNPYFMGAMQASSKVANACYSVTLCHF